MTTGRINQVTQYTQSYNLILYVLILYVYTFTHVHNCIIFSLSDRIKLMQYPLLDQTKLTEKVEHNKSVSSDQFLFQLMIS